MQRTAVFLVLLALVAVAIQQEPPRHVQKARHPTPPEVPRLNHVCDFEFHWSYSCPPTGFNYSYEGSALFLSQQAMADNVPDVVLNGPGCANPKLPPTEGLYFQSLTNNGSASFIADVTMLNRTVSNFTVDSLWYPRGGLNFSMSAAAVPGHTYVVSHADFGMFPNSNTTNSMFVMTVASCNRGCKVQYSVKSWSSNVVRHLAPGFGSNLQSIPTCFAGSRLHPTEIDDK